MLRYLFSISATWMIGAANVNGTDLDCLKLSVVPSQADIIERLPLVFKLTLANTCGHSIDIYYDQKTTSTMEKWAVLRAVDEGGRTYKLVFYGGKVHTRMRVPIPKPVLPGQTIGKECIRSLLARDHSTRRKTGDQRDPLQSLRPGRYSARVEVPHLQGEKIVSNQFEFTVVEAQGVDAEARDRIGKEHFDFFEGRDHPSDVNFYDGRKWWKKVDISRFGEIQKILDDFPDSTYAEWIRFWKLYHHGPTDEALRYAREHREFPLSDNLMLRMAERVFNRAGKYDFTTYRRVRELGRELLRDFPNGDSRPAVQRLLKRLKNKLPPESENE